MTENEVQDRRRTRLFDFVEANGGAASVVAKFRLTKSWPSQYVQIKNGSSFGSRAARNIEAKLKLPELYLDQGPMHSDTSNVSESLGPVKTRRVPVKGAAKMGDGGFYDVVEDDGHVDAYSSDPLAYALRVKGDSMHPAIRHGSIVVVEPSGQCIPGEYVAIAMRDGSKMVKELVIDRVGEMVIESVNGNHRQTLDKSAIEQMHPIASVVSASKWRERE